MHLALRAVRFRDAIEARVAAEAGKLGMDPDATAAHAVELLDELLERLEGAGLVAGEHSRPGRQLVDVRPGAAILSDDLGGSPLEPSACLIVTPVEGM